MFSLVMTLWNQRTHRTEIIKKTVMKYKQVMVKKKIKVYICD